MSRGTKVLVTGFEPFDGMPSNPSWAAALAAQEHWAGRDDAAVVARLLPVDFAVAPRALAHLVAEEEPDVVVGLGVAVGRDDLCAERVAVNCVDARIPDEAGHQPQGEWIDEDAPVGYFSTLPLHAVVEAWDAAGVPGRISDTAGTYVCNRVMFEVLRRAEEWGLRRAGFLHVPPTPGLRPTGPVTASGLAQDRTDTGVVRAVEAILDAD